MKVFKRLIGMMYFVIGTSITILPSLILFTLYGFEKSYNFYERIVIDPCSILMGDE